MNTPTITTNQRISNRIAYISIDGVIKYCITAPLLELPIDFKEWYKPAHS